MIPLAPAGLGGAAALVALEFVLDLCATMLSGVWDEMRRGKNREERLIYSCAICLLIDPIGAAFFGSSGFQTVNQTTMAS